MNNLQEQEQKKWKYNLEKHCVDEQPTMGEPLDISVHTDEAVSQYRRRIASLCSIPVSGKVDWKDGEDVTGKFEIRHSSVVGGGLVDSNEIGGKGLEFFENDFAIPIINQSKPILQDNEIYWKELRKRYFNECTQRDSIDGTKIRIDIAPHDLFEWFKSKLSVKIESLQNKIQELENDYMNIQTELQTAKFLKEDANKKTKA